MPRSLSFTSQYLGGRDPPSNSLDISIIIISRYFLLQTLMSTDEKNKDSKNTVSVDKKINPEIATNSHRTE